MNSPFTALAWEIWRRRRGSAWVVLACIAVGVLVNRLILDHFKFVLGDDVGNLSPFFGMLMTLSFLLLMGIFNYTEISNREWSGFPYRLFVLPVPTWQLVLLPMALGVAAVELNYYAWVKLVWTHNQISMPEWFAVVLGVYVVLYQTTLWSLASFRVARLVALASGGISIFAVACLPFLSAVPVLTDVLHLSWVTEKRLIAILTALALTAATIAWATVARQRSGGGRRQSWMKAIVDRLLDALPRSAGEFSSPAAAQFWFEWRRAGWILPVCTTFAVMAIFVPVTWFNRHNSHFTDSVLVRLLAMPVVLALVVGKGFIKPEFWNMNLSMSAFMAVKPMGQGEMVVTKLKVAAVSAVLAWVPVVVFAALWLPLWAEKIGVEKEFFLFRQLYPLAWLPIIILAIFALMVLTWRLLAGGLWAGVSGKRNWYYGVPAFQLAVIALLSLAAGIWSNTIDRFCDAHPGLAHVLPLRITSWILCALVILKFWTAAFSWNQITPRRTWQYLVAWSCATLCLVALALLYRPPFDMDRIVYPCLLAALWLVPIARFGIAPHCLAMNRHR